MLNCVILFVHASVTLPDRKQLCMQSMYPMGTTHESWAMTLILKSYFSTYCKESLLRTEIQSLNFKLC